MVVKLPGTRLLTLTPGCQHSLYHIVGNHTHKELQNPKIAAPEYWSMREKSFTIIMSTNARILETLIRHTEPYW